MSREKVNELTRREWRELGFYYDRDDTRKEWQIHGSRAGLSGLARILQQYSGNPRRQPLGEHDHLGPYGYLEIGTWSTRALDKHWIAGSPDDLRFLSALIVEWVLSAKEGDVLRLRDAFAPGSPYDLRLELMNDEFDPAIADGLCW